MSHQTLIKGYDVVAFKRKPRLVFRPSLHSQISIILSNNICINRIYVSLQAGTYGKPSIGPKEADKNVRNFTEEQLRAGQGVISLQYGSNKGANQSGINFGNTRHM